MIILALVSFCGGMFGSEVPLVQVRKTTSPRNVVVVATLPEELLDRLAEGKLPEKEGEHWLRLALIDDQSGLEGPAILGNYRRESGKLIFVPRYGLVHAHRYRATLTGPGGELAAVEYRVPPRPFAAPTVVEKIFPSDSVLPANLLKFYVHFSKPMREGKEIFDQIQILGPDGHPIPAAWRRTELWSRDSKRLTLYIHPGRIKRGLNLRVEFGGVLEPNRSYCLVIPATLRDAQGQELAQSYRKEFTTTNPDRTRPLPKSWSLQSPCMGTKEPLRLRMDQPLDRVLLERLLFVQDDRGKIVEGQVTIGPRECSWSLTPNVPWRSEVYSFEVGDLLEDLAGNTPVRLFDTDLQEPVPQPPTLTLGFRPISSALPKRSK